jgi:hypothetical protein
MTPGRRTLRYGNLDEIMADVDRLAAGHMTVGQWSLAQICRHLATTMRRTVDLPATPYDASMWVGQDQKQKFFESGLVPEGIPTLPPLVPLEARCEADEVEGLRQAIAYYKGSPGPNAPHIFFGFMSREEWDHFHGIHAAHHLSFAVPLADSD